MAGRPPAAEARMVVDVARAVGRRRLEHRAEYTVCPRQGAERGNQLVAHARGDEAPETAFGVWQPEGRVLSLRELSSAVYESLQDVLDRKLRRDCEHGVADRLQRRVDLRRHSPDDTP